MSMNENKCFLRGRVEDITVNVNRRTQFENILCSSCDSKSEETQSHTLEGKTLNGPSAIVTYLQNYRELFGDDIEAQVYVSILIKDNHG